MDPCRGQVIPFRSAATAEVRRPERELLERALAEFDAAPPHAPSGPAVVALVQYAAPRIHQHVLRVVLTYGRGRDVGDLRSTVEEYAQLVLERLFERRAEYLRAWREDGGRTLAGWIVDFAGKRTIDESRRKGRAEWRHQATPAETFDAAPGGARPDESVQASELYRLAREDVLATLSADRQHLFALLLEQDQSTSELRAATGMTDGAIFQQRRRLRQALTEALRRHGGHP